MTTLENRIPPPVLTLFTCLAIGLAAWMFPGLASQNSLSLWMAAFILCIGLFALLLAVTAFRRAKTTINPVNIDRASSLVTSGIFRVTRNPMYLGMAIIISSLAIALGNAWFFLGTLFFIAFITRFQAIPEERVMRLKFESEYDQYCQRVRRWI